MEKKIKLNHNCKRCDKAIYIDDYHGTEEGVFHLECLLDNERDRIIKIISDIMDKELDYLEKPETELNKALVVYLAEIRKKLLVGVRKR